MKRQCDARFSPNTRPYHAIDEITPSFAYSIVTVAVMFQRRRSS